MESEDPQACYFYRQGKFPFDIFSFFVVLTCAVFAIAEIPLDTEADVTPCRVFTDRQIVALREP